MSKYIPENHKHLTASDRLYIEHPLNTDSPFKDIARYLCKDPNIISKEIRSHRLSDFYPGRGIFLNAKTSVYTVSIVRRRMSAAGLTAPYVCNGCGKAPSPINTTMLL